MTAEEHSLGEYLFIQFLECNFIASSGQWRAQTFLSLLTIFGSLSSKGMVIFLVKVWHKVFFCQQFNEKYIYICIEDLMPLTICNDVCFHTSKINLSSTGAHAMSIYSQRKLGQLYVIMPSRRKMSELNQ